MTSTFEDRLLNELKQEVQLRAAVAEEAATEGTSAPDHTPGRRRITPRRLALGVAACTAAATAVIFLPGGSGGTPAYAVDKNPDGSVTLTLKDVTPDEGEQQAVAKRLRAAGVQVVFDNPQRGNRCRQPRGEEIVPPLMTMDIDRLKNKPVPASGERGPERPEAQPGDQEESRIWRATLQPGDTVLIENQDRSMGPLTLVAAVKGKADPCELVSVP